MPFSRRLGVWLLGLASFSGCYSTSDRIHQEFNACSNKHRAMKVWCQCRSEYAECQDYLWDFGAGFRQGYADVAGGANGCPPALPPRKYWGHCYKSAEGQCAIAAWFDGYQHGAAVAASDGANAYGRVPTSDDIYGRSCPAPVTIDLEQYKSSHAGSAPTRVPMQGDIPPIPEDPEGYVPAPGDYHSPYSPEVLPHPPTEQGPSARQDATALPVF